MLDFVEKARGRVRKSINVVNRNPIAPAKHEKKKSGNEQGKVLSRCETETPLAHSLCNAALRR